MFLQFIQGFSLLFDHITMGKGEVVDSLYCLHFILVIFFKQNTQNLDWGMESAKDLPSDR